MAGTAPASAWQDFRNEPDTDFTLVQNSEWAKSIITDWANRHGSKATEVPLFVAGERVAGEPVDGERVAEEQLFDTDRPRKENCDPSRPGIVVSRYLQATEEEADKAIACATWDPGGWRAMEFSSRAECLHRVADEIRSSRAELMGAALAEAGKALLESDPEVSEAVDFCEFYAASSREFFELPNVQAAGSGVVVVVSPWNFPIAIPCGGIAAALAAGNTVILKPASATVMIAHVLCQCFYRAGVPRTALQLLPCSGSDVGQKLVADPRVSTVILTGGTETALNMLKHRPETKLLAETGGKNATIVTALADRDQAIKHVIHSAFSHSGQKCSATSLLLLEDEVFNDERFKQTLIDAVESLDVGSSWDLKNRIGPLVSVPRGDLERGLKDLEAGESWALMPRVRDGNPQLYSPGIKWNARPGEYTHGTEFFGPVLAVMKFTSLAEAINIVNQTGFGLTSGLESLDDREQQQWMADIRAGNLYVNRPTTGAIVLRQPFGGIGKSAFGPGIKAGGPNYVAQLMNFEMAGPPSGDGEIRNNALQQLAEGLQAYWDGEILSHIHVRADLTAEDVAMIILAIRSYDFQAMLEFNRRHDHFRLPGQDNIRRYLPIDSVCVRVAPDDTAFEIFARVAAAHAAGCRVLVSAQPGTIADCPDIELLDNLTERWAADIEFDEQSDEQLIEAIQSGEIRRLRYASPDRVPLAIRKAVIGKFIHIADARVLPEGRLELLWYLQEQSISVDYHRYGNTGNRADEERAEVL